MKDGCLYLYLHLYVDAAAAAVGRTLQQRDTTVKTIRQRILQQQQQQVEELVVLLEQEGDRSASLSRSFEVL